MKFNYWIITKSVLYKILEWLSQKEVMIFFLRHVTAVNKQLNSSKIHSNNIPICLVHPGVRDKRRVSEIDLSQPRHETAFSGRHNGPVTSQYTDRIKWPNYPVELIGIYVHTTKNPWHKDVVDRQIYNCVWCFCTYPYGLSLNGWHALLCIANNRHAVTITTHPIKRHFLIWMTTVRQPTKRRRSCVLTLKYTFICVYWWTRQRIHDTLIVVDRYLRLVGDKAIPESAEPLLESFYPPFVG